MADREAAHEAVAPRGSPAAPEASGASRSAPAQPAEAPAAVGQALPHLSAKGLESRRLYLCSPDRPDLEAFLAACLRGGVDVVQMREKTLDARPLVARARRAKAVCADFGVPFLLNDRPDLALEAGANGVHVGQDDVTPAVARRILGGDAIIGLSTHAPAEWDAARLEPVDYLSAGPVHPTPTKPGRPATGLGFLRHAASAATRPWYVTGGASPQTIPAMAAAGASRFVVVRYLTEASDPEANARRLRRAIDRAVDP